MKRFITVSPFQPKENLTKGKYAAVDNSKLLYDGEIQFPILTAINGYVEDGEEINVLCIQADYDNAIENTKEFEVELKELCDKKQIKYTLNIIKIEHNNNLETHLDTFHKLIQNCEDEDEIYACITYGFKPMPMIEVMALNYACKIKKNTKVNCVVYGEKDFSTGEMKVYDVTSLYLLDGVIQRLAQAKVTNPMKQIEMLLDLGK